MFNPQRCGNVHFNNNMQDMSKDGLILVLTWTLKNVKLKTKVLELIHSNLCDLHAIPSMGNKKYFVIFIDDASRFCYVYLLHSKDEALDKFKVFKTEVELQQGSQIKRFRTDRGGLSQGFWGEAMGVTPSLSIPKGTEDIGGSVVTDEVVQQPEFELRKSKRNRTPKDFGPEFQLYLIEGTMDEVSDQHSYCFNVEDDPKTFDEAMKSRTVAFWKDAINDEMGLHHGNNTWYYHSFVRKSCSIEQTILPFPMVLIYTGLELQVQHLGLSRFGIQLVVSVVIQVSLWKTSGKFVQTVGLESLLLRLCLSFFT
ncbi:zinc finger, CCHC-type containing protein, partial [Tanacetum coccineum]